MSYTGASPAIPGTAITTNVRVFTSNGSYIPSFGLISATFETVGGGGGGGGVAGTSGQTYAGGGGGSGGYSRATRTAAQIGASQTVTIGLGGNGGVAGANGGSAGGDTSVGTLCIAKGGTGGSGSSSGLWGAGGLGGIVGTGDVTIPGNAGGTGLYSQNNIYKGASTTGGPSFFGGAPVVPIAGGNSVNGTNASPNTGAGGSGAVADSSATNAAGGNGASGIVVITEFIVTNNTLSFSLVPNPRGILTLSAAYNVSGSDRESILNVSGSWTLGHTVTAATAGAGFRYTLRNTGNGTITIDPQGSETIDGSATLLCLSKQQFDVVSDGTNWFTVGRQTKILIGRNNFAGTNTAMQWVLPPDYTSFWMDYIISGSTVNGDSLGIRFAVDGVPNFLNPGYYWGYSYADGANGFSSGTAYNSAYGGMSHGAGAPHQLRGYGLINPGGTNAQDFPSWVMQSGVFATAADGRPVLGEFSGYQTNTTARSTHLQLLSVNGSTLNGWAELWGNV